VRQNIGKKPQVPPLRFALSKRTLQPPDFEWVAQVSLLGPGSPTPNSSGLGPICQPEHPGLKSETWATHSTFVRASFIFLSGLQAHEYSGRDDNPVVPVRAPERVLWRDLRLCRALAQRKKARKSGRLTAARRRSRDSFLFSSWSRTQAKLYRKVGPGAFPILPNVP
jgi:hypothetical protein